MEIKKILNKHLNEEYEKQKLYKVFESKYYYSNYKDILFTGTYDECVRFILANSELSLEMIPVDSNGGLSIKESVINENNLAIIGSRSFNNYSFAKNEILNIIKNNKIGISKIISGGASGADKIAEIFASKFNIPVEVIVPDWSKGRGAGMVRNTDIIKKSDYVIAFWDGKSKGTLDSINKAKRLNKKLFIVYISPEKIEEGIRLNDNGEYTFDYNEDKKDDILYLKYNKDFITTKVINGVVSYFTYKINKNIDKNVRFDLLNYIKGSLKDTNQYDNFLNKSVVGLFNNPNIEVSDADLILIPESSSSLNFDLANKIKNKIPNALFLKDVILKNEPTNVTLDYELLKEKNYDQKTIMDIEKMIQRATIDGVFKIKKIHPRFRKFIINFLQMDVKNKQLLNKLVNGKIIVVDDFVSEGTTFRDTNRILENFAPKEVILFSLIG